MKLTDVYDLLNDYEMEDPYIYSTLYIEQVVDTLQMLINDLKQELDRRDEND